MKTLNQYLLYDEDCPLCTWYTRQFVKYGFLQQDARLPYHKGVEDNRFQFNHDRAKDEIALVSEEDDKVYYGFDSLLRVLGRKWRWAEIVGKFPPVYWLLRMLYQLVSLNRKVIAPVICSTNCSCAPRFSFFWRISFIIMCGLATNAMVHSYFTEELSPFIRFSYGWIDFSFFVGQLAFQWVFFKLLKQASFWNYAGHVAFISLVGAMLLAILQLGLGWFAKLGVDIALLQPVAYGMVLSFMLLEHMRRVKILDHSKWLTVTWFVYRLLIYPIAFVV